MKYAKILLGIVIILAGISEYFDSYRQCGEIDIALIIVLIIIGCISFLLIRSGIKTNKKIGHRNTLSSFLWILVYCILIIVGLGLFLEGFKNYKKPMYFITVSDGTKIPLDYCINGSKKEKIDFNEAKEYCECLIEKLYENYKHDPVKIRTIKTGKRLDRFLKSMNPDDILKYKIFDCYKNSSDNNWSESLEKKVTNSLKQGLENSDFKEYYNTDKYCKCVIEYLKEKDVKDVFTEQFFGSDEFLRIDSICKSNSEN
jgi:hypothetical protein